MSLAAKITALNTVNHVMNSLAPEYINIFSPFAGTKTYNKSGTKTKQLEKALANVEEFIKLNYSSVQVFLRYSWNQLYLNVKTSAPDANGSSCTYAEQSIFLGYVSDEGVFTPNKLAYEGVFTPNERTHDIDFKTDFNLETIKEAREKIKALEAQISAIQSDSQLHNFQNEY